MNRAVRSTILAVLEGDESFLLTLQQRGFLPLEDDGLLPEHVELARVTQNLVRELEVNWEGVEIVLRMRAELIATRHQIGELLALLDAAHRTPRR